jgi:predicted Zn-dependent protease
MGGRVYRPHRLTSVVGHHPDVTAFGGRRRRHQIAEHPVAEHVVQFTAVDLFPAPSWNFVFGQASLAGRVGVWSFARNGNPAEGEAGFRRCLARTLRIAAHEVGHMFGMATARPTPAT